MTDNEIKNVVIDDIHISNEKERQDSKDYSAYLREREGIVNNADETFNATVIAEYKNSAANQENEKSR